MSNRLSSDKHFRLTADEYHFCYFSDDALIVKFNQAESVKHTESAKWKAMGLWTGFIEPGEL